MTEKVLVKTLVTSKQRSVAFSILFLIVGVLPVFLHSQWITGPMINAALLIACVLMGPLEALVLGLIPSTVALSAGLLPLPLAPMVPFIMISNGILVLIFHHLRKINYWLALGTGAFFKSLFLYLTVTLLMQILLDGPIVEKLSVMMSWPQLITALIGGVVAYVILAVYKKYEK